jgi:CBS domain-containing protein
MPVLSSVGGTTMTTVDDILRPKDTRILTVRLRETLATAVALMKRENVSALVVKDVCRTEGNVVVGVLSERDVARALATHGAAALHMEVAAFVNRPLASCTLRHTLDDVLQLMNERQVRLLPVLEDHTLVGVVSISDVIRYLAPPSVAEASANVTRRASLERFPNRKTL